MANQAAKKRKIENDKQIKNLQLGILAVNVFYLLYRILWGWSTFSNWHIFGWTFTTGIYVFCYLSIAAMAKASYGEDGELVSGGADLDMKGLLEYYFDAIYITGIIQITTAIISDKFWYLYVLAFGYAFYNLWQSFLKPMFFNKQPTEGEEDPKAKAKREKKEKRDERQKVKYVR